MNIELNSKHPFYSANDFYREQFGHKLIKLSFDGGFTCPNRDGTLSTQGCIFCGGRGSGDFAANRNKSIVEQYTQALNLISKKWSRYKNYIAYFQAFTNTYAPIDRLRELYFEAASLEGVEAVSVATRPDCLNTEVLELLEELSRKCFVFVELGLQTAKPESVKMINRCYKNEVYKKAVCELKKRNINVITHIILGLPNENIADMQGSVQYAVDCGTDGIKLQLLHILRDTKLYETYCKTPFKVFEADEYISLIVGIVERLPQNICIHRITGDGSREQLVQPLWSLDKRRVLNGISKEFIKRNTWQGKFQA